MNKPYSIVVGIDPHQDFYALCAKDEDRRTLAQAQYSRSNTGHTQCLRWLQTLVFLAARYLFADAARRKLGALGERIRAGFTDNAFSWLLFLRLVPLFPFFLVNIAPAFTGIRVRTFVLATLVGIIPGTFVYVNLGQALGRIDSMSGLLSRETLLAFGLLGLFALLPVAWKKWKGGAVGDAKRP